MRTSDLIRTTLGIETLFSEVPDLSGAIQYRSSVSDTSKLCVILGQNATGKSLVRRCLGEVATRHGAQKVMCISQEKRSDTSFGGLGRVAVFGSEADESSGFISARTAMKAMKSSEVWDVPHLVILDEPDLGLSEDYAAGLGARLAAFSLAPPDLLRGLFVISHSRALLAELARVDHSMIGIGGMEAPASLGDWLRRPPSPRDPMELMDRGRETWSLVHGALQAVRARRKGKA